MSIPHESLFQHPARGLTSANEPRAFTSQGATLHSLGSISISFDSRPGLPVYPTSAGDPVSIGRFRSVVHSLSEPS
jgi:hypothetical protein